MVRAPAPPRAARELFAGDSHLLCNFAEIDPFGPRADVEYLGPLADSTSGLEVAWQTRDRPRILAYLKPRDPRFAELVAALRKVAGEALVAAPGLADPEAEELSSNRVRVFSQPLRLDGVLEAADLCLAHGGAGLTARCVVAGVPLALLPMQLEQDLIARRLKAAGAAEMLSPDDPPPG